MDARLKAMSEQAHGPHHMEHVAKVNDVVYINDSKATFLDATLESLGQMEGRVVWVVGGLSREMNGEVVQALIKEKVSAIIVFGHSPEAVESGAKPPVEHVYVAEELRTAVFLAKEIATPAESVLFSPACPSGNGFANYEERGAEFKRAVRDL